MDSLKLECYLEAARRIADGRSKFACFALLHALDDIGIWLSYEELPKFFPEFFALDDGTFTDVLGEVWPSRKEPSAQRSWWIATEAYPDAKLWRIRALELAASRVR